MTSVLERIMGLSKVANTPDFYRTQSLLSHRDELSEKEKEELRKALMWRNRVRAVFRKNPDLKEYALGKTKRLLDENAFRNIRLRPETTRRLRNLEKVLERKGSPGWFGV